MVKKNTEEIKDVETPTSEDTQENHEKQLPIDEEERFLASIGYIGFLCFLPLLKKDSEFCQWHGRQSLVFNSIVFLVGLFLLAMPSSIPVLGVMFDLLKLLFFITALILLGMAYGNAKKGGKWEIPYIQDYVNQLPYFKL